MKADTEWVDIFDAIDVAWCFGQNGCREDHDGWVEQDPSGLIIHWSDRRITRPSIHKALRKIAMAAHPEHGSLPAWRGLYLRNAEILTLARRAHLRLPRSVFDLDRARVRFLLSEHTQANRRRMTPSEQTDFRAALRWAARS